MLVVAGANFPTQNNLFKKMLRVTDGHVVDMKQVRETRVIIYFVMGQFVCFVCVRFVFVLVYVCFANLCACT